MAAKPDHLFEYLDGLGIKTETYTHPPLFTVEESKALRGNIGGGHCKNLFLKDSKGMLWLVVALEDHAIDMKALRRRIGSGHLSFGKPELLSEILGVEPGSVSPFALINDREKKVNVILDRQMMEMELLNYHPLTNTKTTQITPHDLVVFIQSCGHLPKTVDI